MRVVLITAPPDVAHELARRVVDEELAACVNVAPGITSHYRWNGETRADAESLLIAKVAADRLDHFVARMQKMHPYDNPEIVALDAVGGSEPYLAWVRGGGG